MIAFDAAKYIILFDEHCPLCQRSIRFLMRQRGSSVLKPLPLQTPGLLAQFHISESAAMREIHVVDSAGAIWRGADGVLVALSALARWRWVALLLRVPGFIHVARPVYRFIARRRSRAACDTGACQL